MTIIELLVERERRIHMGFIFKSPEEKVAKLIAKRDVNSLAKLLDSTDIRFPASKALGTLGETAINAVKPYLKSDSLLTAWSAAELLISLGWEPTKLSEHIDYLIGIQQWERVVALGEEGATALLERILSPYMGDYARLLMIETAFCDLVRTDWLSTGNFPREGSATHRFAGFQFLRTQGGDGSQQRFGELLEIEYHEMENIFLFLHLRPALALLNMGPCFVDKIVHRLKSHKFQYPRYDIAMVGPLIFVLEKVGKDSQIKQSFMRELADKVEKKAKADRDWMELFSFFKRAESLAHEQIHRQLRLDKPFWAKLTDFQKSTSCFIESKVNDKKLKSTLDMLYISGDASNIFYMLHQASDGIEQGIICLGCTGDLRTLPSLIEIRQNSKSWDCVKASAEAIRRIVLLSIDPEKGEMSK
jgi:hypothetical protein